jgi:hypothetical protein
MQLLASSGSGGKRGEVRVSNTKSQRFRQQCLLAQLLDELGIRVADLKPDVRERMLAVIAHYQLEADGATP